MSNITMKVKDEWYIIPDRKEIDYDEEEEEGAIPIEERPTVDVLLNDDLKDNEKVIFIILDKLKKKHIGGQIIKTTYQEIAQEVGKTKGWLSKGKYIDTLREKNYILNNQKGFLIPYINFFNYMRKEGVHYLRVPETLIDGLKNRKGYKARHLIVYLLLLRVQLMKIADIKEQKNLTIEKVEEKIKNNDKDFIKQLKINPFLSTIAKHTPYGSKKIRRTFRELKELGLIIELDRNTTPSKIDNEIRIVERIEFICRVIPSLYEKVEREIPEGLEDEMKYNSNEQFNSRYLA